MRLVLAGALALAGIGALGATAHGVQPQPPLCACVQTSWWGTCSDSSLGTGTSTLSCTVNYGPPGSATTCSIGGGISWTPANPQTCATIPNPSYWGMPTTSFNPLLSQGTQNFFPSGSVVCGGTSPYPYVHGWINVPDYNYNCWLYCRAAWDCVAQ